MEIICQEQEQFNKQRNELNKLATGLIAKSNKLRRQQEAQNAMCLAAKTSYNNLNTLLDQVRAKIEALGAASSTRTKKVQTFTNQKFKKAILCVRYITDFGLIVRYHSHTDSTVKYMHIWHPLAFHNKRFLTAELNYDVHDKEMVITVNCFQECRYFLIGAPKQIVIYTDHKNL